MSEAKKAPCTPAEWLFKVPQVWRVPNYMVENTQFVTIIGRHTTGNKLTDRKIANDLTDIHVFTSQIAELCGEGHRLMPYDEETGVRTYDYVTEHLINWANYLSKRRLIQKPIPIDGLREFSKLAGLLIKIARQEGYIKRLRKRRDFFKALRGEKKTEAIQEDYNNAMIEAIEKAYRTQTADIRMQALGGVEYEKRRI